MKALLLKMPGTHLLSRATPGKLATRFAPPLDRRDVSRPVAGCRSRAAAGRSRTDLSTVLSCSLRSIPGARPTLGGVCETPASGREQYSMERSSESPGTLKHEWGNAARCVAGDGSAGSSAWAGRSWRSWLVGSYRRERPRSPRKSQRSEYSRGPVGLVGTLSSTGVPNSAIFGLCRYPCQAALGDIVAATNSTNIQVIGLHAHSPGRALAPPANSPRIVATYIGVLTSLLAGRATS